MINIANWERILRVVAGALVFSLVFVGPETLWGFLGVVPLLTGLSGFCPLYAVFGFSTCPTGNSQKPRSA
jgi:hypothetical protein